MKKSQLEAAYERQRKEIADLKTLWPVTMPMATRNMAMSRQKKLDKMDIIELQSESQSHPLASSLPYTWPLYLSNQDFPDWFTTVRDPAP